MAVEADEVREQVDRLVHSRVFETSEVHRRLLQYLAEKTLSGEADRLKEYTVGLDAFSKPATYDPRHDSIVRLQVGRLRQKLTTYYQTEASPEEIQISLPKGAFKLAFKEVPPPDNGRDGPPQRLVWILAVALAIALGWAMIATTGWLAARKKIATIDKRWSPELETLWEPFLGTDRSVLVCLGSPMFVRFPTFGFFRDPRLNDWQEVERSERVTAMRTAIGASDMHAWYAFTGAGEASGAFQIARLLSAKKSDLLLTRSNLMSWQQVADHDVVFIGPPKFNLQLQTAALTQDLVMEADGIRNLKAKPGEPVFLMDRILPGKMQEGETHALISLIPGLSGTGELLMISGNASPDTQAAADWLTQPARAAELVRHLRAGGRTVPRYFQAVIKVAFKQGMPVQSSYVFHHSLDERAQVQ